MSSTVTKTVADAHAGHVSISGHLVKPSFVDEVPKPATGTVGAFSANGTALDTGLGMVAALQRAQGSVQSGELRHRNPRNALYHAQTNDTSVIINLGVVQGPQWLVENTTASGTVRAATQPGSLLDLVPKKSIFERAKFNTHVPLPHADASSAQLEELLETGSVADAVTVRIMAFALEHRLCPFTGRLRPSSARATHLCMDSITGSRDDAFCIRDTDQVFERLLNPGHGDLSLDQQVVIFGGPGTSNMRGKALLAAIGRQGGPVYGHANAYCAKLFEKALQVIIVGETRVTTDWPNVQAQDFEIAIMEALTVLSRFNGVTTRRMRGFAAVLMQNLNVVDQFLISEKGQSGELSYDMAAGRFDRRPDHDDESNTRLDVASASLLGPGAPGMGGSPLAATLDPRARRDYLSEFCPSAERVQLDPDPNNYVARAGFAINQPMATWLLWHSVPMQVGNGVHQVAGFRSSRTPEVGMAGNTPPGMPFTPSLMRGLSAQYVAGRGAGRLVLGFNATAPDAPPPAGLANVVGAAIPAVDVTRFGLDALAARALNVPNQPPGFEWYYAVTADALPGAAVYAFQALEFLDATPHAWAPVDTRIRNIPGGWNVAHNDLAGGLPHTLNTFFPRLAADIGAQPEPGLRGLREPQHCAQTGAQVLSDGSKLYIWWRALGNAHYASDEEPILEAARNGFRRARGVQAKRNGLCREALLPLGGQYVSVHIDILPGLWPIHYKKPLQKITLGPIIEDPLSWAKTPLGRVGTLTKMAASSDLALFALRASPIRLAGRAYLGMDEQKRISGFPLRHASNAAERMLDPVSCFRLMTIYRSTVFHDKQAEALMCVRPIPMPFLRAYDPRVGQGAVALPLDIRRYMINTIPTKLGDQGVFSFTGYHRGTWLATPELHQHMAVQMFDAGIYTSYHKDPFPGVALTLSAATDELTFRVAAFNQRARSLRGVPGAQPAELVTLTPTEFVGYGISGGYTLDTSFLMTYNHPSEADLPPKEVRYSTVMETSPQCWVGVVEAGPGILRCSTFPELRDRLQQSPQAGVEDLQLDLGAGTSSRDGPVYLIDLDQADDSGAPSYLPLPLPQAASPGQLVFPDAYVPNTSGLGLTNRGFHAQVRRVTHQFSNAAGIAFQALHSLLAPPPVISQGAGAAGGAPGGGDLGIPVGGIFYEEEGMKKLSIGYSSQSFTEVRRDAPSAGAGEPNPAAVLDMSAFMAAFSSMSAADRNKMFAGMSAMHQSHSDGTHGKPQPTVTRGQGSTPNADGAVDDSGSASAAGFGTGSP